MTGYGLVQARGVRTSIVEAGVIRSDSSDSLADRVRTIYLQLRDILREFEPDVIAVEELYSHYKHPVTSILMGHARGVLFLAAAEAGLPVESYAATRIKKALTGSGRASKEQVQRMIQSTLGLAALPEPADVSDALAVALCHANVLMRGAVR